MSRRTTETTTTTTTTNNYNYYSYYNYYYIAARYLSNVLLLLHVLQARVEEIHVHVEEVCGFGDGGASRHQDLSVVMYVCMRV